jgi:hypothetical protein
MQWRTPVDGSGETSIGDGYCDWKGAVRAPRFSHWRLGHQSVLPEKAGVALFDRQENQSPAT